MAKENSIEKDWYEIVAKLSVTVIVQVNKYKAEKKHYTCFFLQNKLQYQRKLSYWLTILTEW